MSMLGERPTFEGPVRPELPDYNGHTARPRPGRGDAEWALTPMGHCWNKEECAIVITSIIHLDSLCFVTGDTLVRLPKHTKSCSECLKGAEHSIYRCISIN